MSCSSMNHDAGHCRAASSAVERASRADDDSCSAAEEEG